MDDNSDLIALTIDVVAAFVGQNNMRPEDVPAFIATTHAAIAQLKSAEQGVSSTPAAEEYVPAVSVRKSLASKEHILSLIDGKPYKTLRRHLTKHGLTPDQYRARYKLADSYPMVAENYSAHRRDLANKSGLGRKIVPVNSGRATAAVATQAPKEHQAQAKPESAPLAAKRGRKANGNGAVKPQAESAVAAVRKGRATKQAAPAALAAAPAPAKGRRKAKAEPQAAAASQKSPKADPKPKKRLSLKLVPAANSSEKPA